MTEIDKVRLTSSVNSEVVSLEAPFEFGQPLSLSFDLFANISVFDSTFPFYYDFSASVDFENSATLTTMLVTDTNGVPIPGVSVLAESGTAYPVSPLNAPIPIPATLPLLGAALGGLLFVVRWPRRPA